MQKIPEADSARKAVPCRNGIPTHRAVVRKGGTAPCERCGIMIDDKRDPIPPPRAMAYAYGFAGRTRGDWHYRAGNQFFDAILDAAIRQLNDKPIESLPYVVVRLENGFEGWIRRRGHVVVDPAVVEVSIDLSAEPGEIFF